MTGELLEAVVAFVLGSTMFMVLAFRAPNVDEEVEA